MMFMFHVAVSLSLIAAALGVMLVTSSKCNEGSVLAKLFGWLIVIIAVGGIACSVYTAKAFWHDGHFASSCNMQSMQTSAKTKENT